MLIRRSVCGTARLGQHAAGKRLKHADSRIWGAVREIWLMRTGATALRHVRGHSGDPGNERADAEANRGRATAVEAWNLEGLEAPDHQYDLQVMGWTMHLPVARMLKDVVGREHRRTWEEHVARRQPALVGVGEIRPRLDTEVRPEERMEEQDRQVGDPGEAAADSRTSGAAEEAAADRAAIKAVEPEYKGMNRPRTGDRQTHLEAFGVKLLSGMLPTMVRQYAWGYAAYPDPLCRRCGLEPETQMHVRTCTRITDEVRRKVTRGFVEGVRTVVTAQRAVVATAMAPHVTDGDVLRTDWIVMGVAPGRLVEELAVLTGCRPARVERAVRTGLACARLLVYDLVWRERCRETVKWERRQRPRITPTSKRRRDGEAATAAVATLEAMGVEYGKSGHKETAADKMARRDEAVREWVAEAMAGWRLVRPNGREVTRGGGNGRRAVCRLSTDQDADRDRNVSSGRVWQESGDADGRQP